ncbi:unnamed protein product [Lampetra planeri]
MLREAQDRAAQQANAAGEATPIVKLVFWRDRHSDKRPYNASTANEIAMVFVNNDAMEPEASLKLEDEGRHVGVDTWAGLKLEVEALVVGADDWKPEIGDIRVKTEPDDVPVLGAGDLKPEVGNIRVKIEPNDGGEGEEGCWAFAQPCAQRLEVEVMMDDPLNAGAHDVKVERDGEASVDTRTFVDVEVVVDHIGRCGGDVKVKRDDGEADVSTKAWMDVGAPVDDNGHGRPPPSACETASGTRVVSGSEQRPVLRPCSVVLRLLRTDEGRRPAPRPRGGADDIMATHACDRCPYRARQRRQLVAHILSHTGEKPFKCAACGKSFASLNNVRKHHNTVHLDLRPFKCPRCGKCFTSRTFLRMHMLRHTGERPHECARCGKLFRHRSSLDVHKRTHTGEKPFGCAQCGKMFSRRHHLHHHELTHTGEKPCKCTYCGRTFSHAHNLKTHMRLHTGERPHACSFCAKTFTETGTLKKHLRVHTGEKPFRCSECGKAFALATSRNVHVRKHTELDSSRSGSSARCKCEWSSRRRQ